MHTDPEARRAREALDEFAKDAPRLAARSIMLAPPPGGRASIRIAATDDADAWLTVWAPGSTARVHDAGLANGMVRVLRGSLVERDATGRRTRTRRLRAGTTTQIGDGLDRELRNTGRDEVVCLHVCARHAAYADLDAAALAEQARELAPIAAR